MKEQSVCAQTECMTKVSSCDQVNIQGFQGDSFFHSDKQPELNLENNYQN